MEEWGDGRIEIELVEHDPGKRWSRRAVAEQGAPDSPPPTAAGRPDDDARPHPADGRPPARGQRRLVALTAGVGAAGLLIGWLAGNAGDDPVADTAVSAPPTVTTAPPSFTDDPALVEPEPPVLDPTTTGRPRPRPRPTSTTLPPLEIAPLEGLDPRLVGLPYELVTELPGGGLLYINLADATLTTMPRRGEGGRVLAGDGWVAVPSPSANTLHVIFDGVEGFAPLPTDVWQVFHASGAATMWLADNDVLTGQPGAVREVDAHGDPTGRAVEVPTLPAMYDGAGAFIVTVGGDWFAVSADGSSRLTTGALLAASATAALVEECDEQLMCTVSVVDRQTGARRTLAMPPPSVSGAGAWIPEGASISPDGRFATMTVQNPAQAYRWQLIAIDLTTEAVHVLADDSYVPAVRWTADSRFAFFAHFTEIAAFDTSTGEVVPVLTDQGSANPYAFDMHPSTGSPWGAPSAGSTTASTDASVPTTAVATTAVPTATTGVSG